MSSYKHVIVGCGDVGQRIAQQLLDSGVSSSCVTGFVRSDDSLDQVLSLGISGFQIDLDVSDQNHVYLLDGADCYYLIPPQKSGVEDQRSRALISQLVSNSIKPKKMVLISTTGVYGDCDGQWVTESSPAQPQTDRGKRRLDSELQWLHWSASAGVPLVILRVPGIYANSRIPRERIAKKIPVVNAQECGFTNRIHADDLAAVSINSIDLGVSGEVYNVTDGTPGKISEYLQAACEVLGQEPLPEISMQDAQQQLSVGMLSYLSESRKISNQKMLDHLKVRLRYPNFLEGLKFG